MSCLFGQLCKDVSSAINNDSIFIGKLFAKLEAMTSRSREKIFSLLATWVCLYLVIGHGAQLLCNFIGYGYPLIKSIMAIESEDKADDKQWLIYWAVFGLFTLVDFFSASLYQLFPFYWLAKCLFLLWLYLPKFCGSEKLYVMYIKPNISKIQQLYDEIFEINCKTVDPVE
ncbi:Receptor expression-enhancing protein 5 [Trichinella nativa]|uniref:Receptor expression-enhancing protein n=1 Tax=Trichinella nativa TaxID=6335 RepID=A0A0V1L688_9BILA|nr:Receptor expression-enhancing protein 5 [Trichinella sp. T6]KRZ55021.1 Receptor expression-enhancing protein 5 [Trichinella nativa]OUC43753.1 TB2/DP1, HVA22 family [Trichinella nativa]